MTDDADTDLPELSAADETFVRDLLAGLPPVPVPDELATRIDAALRSAADERAAAADGLGGVAAAQDGGTDDGADADQQMPAAAAAGATVVALDDARVRRHSRRTRVLQVAAVSLLAAAGVLGVVKVAGSGSDAQTSTGAAGAGAPSPNLSGSLLTRSGHAYSDATLVDDVRLLAAHETLPAAAPYTGDIASRSAQGTGPTPGPQATGSPSATATPSPKASTTFGSSGEGLLPSPTPTGDTAVTSHAGLVACLAAVEEGLPDPVTPLAMDQGTYRGQAALVVVLPGSQNPQTSYDVFVVGIACGQNADAHLLLYQLVEAH
jgi:hypothetical protein